MLHSFFFNRGQILWCNLNRNVTSSKVLQNGTYIYQYQWKDDFKKFWLIWNMTGKKASLKPAVAAKNSDTTNLMRHFKGGGGSLSMESGMTPLNNLFVKKITWSDKVNVTVLIIQQKSFEFVPLITQLMLTWLKNSTQNIQKYICRSEKIQCPLWRPVQFAQVMWLPIFAPQCQRLVHPKDPICDI